MLITYTRVPHTTCMEHRILRNCKSAETRMVELSEKTETLRKLYLLIQKNGAIVKLVLTNVLFTDFSRWPAGLLY